MGFITENATVGTTPESGAAYEAPAQTRIGHVHLQVTDIDKALGFYRDILGFKVMQRLGNQVAFVSAGGYHHHIGLNTWNSLGGLPARRQGAGLYHTAILYATRAELAGALRQLVAAKYPIAGSADHGVSEAIYLDDPDGNGVELYWDRPPAQWPLAADGSVQMYTRALDLNALLAE
ncbi:VOC family protein [Hymenobacter antarcticus]|uniref:VOC family protein n=1 Tax=Hymenobacter antarcticus TaxID=486270 RepID=UPI003CD0B89F